MYLKGEIHFILDALACYNMYHDSDTCIFNSFDKVCRIIH